MAALNRDQFGLEERQKLAALLCRLRPFTLTDREAAHLYKTGRHLEEDLEELLALAPARITVEPLPKVEACRYRWSPYRQNSPGEAVSAFISREKTWAERAQKLITQIERRRPRK